MVTLGRLAGGLAHVLNNAMSVILGNAELIESLPGLDRESRACASDLRQGALKAAKLTDSSAPSASANSWSPSASSSTRRCGSSRS